MHIFMSLFVILMDATKHNILKSVIFPLHGRLNSAHVTGERELLPDTA